MDVLEFARIRSCYRNDIVWPFFILFFESICNIMPLYCLAFYFNSGMVLKPVD